MNRTDEKAAPPARSATIKTDAQNIAQPAADEQPDNDMALREHVTANMVAVYEFFGMIFGASWTPEEIHQQAESFASEFMRRRAALIGGVE